MLCIHAAFADCSHEVNISRKLLWNVVGRN